MTDSLIFLIFDEFAFGNLISSNETVINFTIVQYNTLFNREVR